MFRETETKQKGLKHGVRRQANEFAVMKSGLQSKCSSDKLKASKINWENCTYVNALQGFLLLCYWCEYFATFFFYYVTDFGY